MEIFCSSFLETKSLSVEVENVLQQVGNIDQIIKILGIIKSNIRSAESELSDFSA